MKTNKYNIHWQIIRTKARKLKDVDEKIQFVYHWFRNNNNKFNYDRVHNWIKMTGLAYSDEKKAKFVFALKQLENETIDISASDMDNDLDVISDDDIILVFKDLSKRKYGFQYKNVPISHTEFMIKLKARMDKIK